MKKLYLILLFVFSFVTAFSQKVVFRANGANTVADARLMAIQNFYIPRYADTAASIVGSAIGIDTCGAIIYTYDVDNFWIRKCFPVKHWEQVGTGGGSNTDSLFGVQDNLAAANRSFGLNGNNFTYTGEGNFILGDANTILSSTAKLQVKGHPRTNIVAFGNQPVDGIPLSMFNVDTVTAANLSSQPGRWAQIDRRLYMQDNNLTLSDKSGSIVNLGVQGKDSTILNSQGGDLMYGLRSSMFLGKYPGFSGRTVFNSGLLDFDAVPAHLSYLATSGGTSSVNNVRMRGYWAGTTSYLNITNAGDTVDNYIGFLHNGQIQGKILKSYGFYAGSLTSDSSWAFYAPYSTERNYFAGNVAIGGNNTGPTNALEVAGSVRIVDGTQANGYVFTSNASGVGSWQPSSAGASSLQAVTDVGNTTDTSIYTGSTTSYSIYDTVWSDQFKRSSIGSNYVNNAASSTITFPSSLYMNLTGAAGATAWTNLIARTDSTNENKGAITATIVINTKSATSYGFAIGWGNLNSLCCDHHVYGGVTLTTGTCNLFFSGESGNFVYTDATALSIADTDTILLTISQKDWTYRLTYYNYRTRLNHSYSLTGYPAASLLPLTPNGFSRPVFVHLGGDMRVYNFARISQESKNAKNVVIGNSLTLGGNIIDASQRYPYQTFAGNEADVIISAGGGSVAAYSNSTWTADLSRYAAGAAENFWLMCGGNDSLFSVWENQGKPAAITLRNRVRAANKRFIWMTPMPRNGLNLGVVADTIIAIANRLGDPYVDFLHRFGVGATFQLPADFNAGDGTHLTVLAQRYMAAYMDSLYPAYTKKNYTGNTTAYRLIGQAQVLTGILEFNYTSASNGLVIPNDVREVKINPPSTLASMTLTLPAIVPVGTEIIISFGGTLTTGVVVTSFTLAAGSSTQSIVRQGFTTPMSSQYSFGVGDQIYCRYQSEGVWITSPNQTYASTDLYVNGHRYGRGNNAATQSNLVGGYFSGQTLSSGVSNTFYGNQAGQGTSTGNRNTFVGANTGTSNSTGSQSTGVGEEALGSSTGGNNIGVGYAALFKPSGTDNIGIGINTMFEVTSGGRNIAIGTNAGRGNVTGNGNTIIGYGLDSWASAQTGTVAIGADALRRWVSNSSGRNRFGGSIANTDTAATAWIHISAGSATANYAPVKINSGTLLTSPEAGAQEYNNAWYLSTNALNRLGIGGVIYSASDSVVNNSTNATTLVSITTKANTLSTTNETIVTDIRGTFNDAAATETIALTFAGTNILSISPAGNPTGWRINVVITRTGASTAQAMVDFYDDLEFHNSVITQLTGLTFSNTNALVLTGTSSTGTARSIVRNQYRMYWEPAASN